MIADIDTSFMLLMRYKAPVVELEQIRTDYLSHLTTDAARRRATAQSLPFACFRADKSNKSPWMVNIIDLANWLDKAQAEAKKDWSRMNA